MQHFINITIKHRDLLHNKRKKWISLGGNYVQWGTDASMHLYFHSSIYIMLITYKHLKYTSQMHKFCSRITHPSHKILDTRNFLSGKLVTFRESRPASCWLTQDSRTSCTYYYTLCMAKHCRYLVATCNKKISGLNVFPSHLGSSPGTLQILNWIIIIIIWCLPSFPFIFNNTKSMLKCLSLSRRKPWKCTWETSNVLCICCFGTRRKCLVPQDSNFIILGKGLQPCWTGHKCENISLQPTR